MELVCEVEWYCVLLDRNMVYVLRTKVLSSLQNSHRNVKILQKLDKLCLVKMLSRELADVCSHGTSSFHSSSEY